MPKVPPKMKVRSRKPQEIIPITNQIEDLTQITKKAKLAGQEEAKKQAKTEIQKTKSLPYEETEAKPLEFGELLKMNLSNSKEGISALAEDFNSSDQKPIELDELLAFPYRN